MELKSTKSEREFHSFMIHSLEKVARVRDTLKQTATSIELN